MVTVITPTRGRPKNFAVLAECMAAQTYEGEIEWLVVGEDHKGYEVPETARQIRSGCGCLKGWDSLLRNLSRGLDEASFETVLIMEDDDWYHPDYIKVMVETAPKADVLGLKNTPAYLLYADMWMLGTQGWTSNLRLKGSGLQKFAALCGGKVRNPNVDLRRSTDLRRRFRGIEAEDSRLLMVSLRGITPDGISPAHRKIPDKAKADLDGGVLKRWVGAEWADRLRAMKNG